MYNELSFKLHEDGALELSAVFAPDLASQAPKFLKDFQALDPDDVRSRIEIDVAKATVRVDVMIPPTHPLEVARRLSRPLSETIPPPPGLRRPAEGFRPIDMTCEKHPWLEWPHDDCAGPGIPLSDSLDLLRKVMEPDAIPDGGPAVAAETAPEPEIGRDDVAELEPGPLTEVVGDAVDALADEPEGRELFHKHSKRKK